MHYYFLAALIQLYVYTDMVSIDTLNDKISFSSDLIGRMADQEENQILIYEARTNIF